MQNRKAFAVITGASQGLGRAFARECAAQGKNLMLASLPGTGLPELAAELRAQGSEVLYRECDLSLIEGQESLIGMVTGAEKTVDLLVNNVGAGQNGLFDLLPWEGQRRSVELNIQSTMAVTYGLIPQLKKAGAARIITVASLAAFYPMPLFAVYASTKSFLLHWSLALRHELAALGIGVTVLTPGGMYTSEEIRRKVHSQGFAGRLSTMEPETVAWLALKGARRNKAVVIPGMFNKVLWFAGSHAPKSLVAGFIRLRWEKALARFAEDGQAGEEGAALWRNATPTGSSSGRRVASS